MTNDAWRKVFGKDRPCHYCKVRPGTTLDHIIPMAKGGPEKEAWNHVPACQPCNNRKADKMPSCCCPKCKKALAYFVDRNVPARQRHVTGEFPVPGDQMEKLTSLLVSLEQENAPALVLRGEAESRGAGR